MITGGRTITNSAFVGNATSGASEAGAIEGSAILKNTIVSGTVNGLNSAAKNCTGQITDADYNISDDNSCGFSPTGSANNGDGINPGLSSDGLTNNGGPTQTKALAPGSPAIDVIPVVDCTDQNGKRLNTDQRGFPRRDAREGVCDIGAFETQDSCSQNQQGDNNCQWKTEPRDSCSETTLQNAIRAFCGG